MIKDTYIHSKHQGKKRLREDFSHAQRKGELDVGSTQAGYY